MCIRDSPRGAPGHREAVGGAHHAACLGRSDGPGGGLPPSAPGGAEERRSVGRGGAAPPQPAQPAV
eukprot:6638492-Prorocentrum_lima.AAC.1